MKEKLNKFKEYVKEKTGFGTRYKLREAIFSPRFVADLAKSISDGLPKKDDSNLAKTFKIISSGKDLIDNVFVRQYEEKPNTSYDEMLLKEGYIRFCHRDVFSFYQSMNLDSNPKYELSFESFSINCKQNIAENKEDVSKTIQGTCLKKCDEKLLLVLSNSDESSWIYIIPNKNKQYSKDEIIPLIFPKTIGFGLGKSEIATTERQLSKSAQVLIDDLSNSIQKMGKRTILLEGFPGTGKTTIASQIFQNLGFRYISLSPTFMETVFRNSNFRGFYQFIHFFEINGIIVDDIDRVFDKEVSTRYTSEYLSFLETISSEKSKTSLILTCNDFTKFPRSFIRQGRINMSRSMTLPDEQDRRDIVVSLRTDLTEDRINEIITKTQNFSPAEVVGLMNEAEFLGFETAFKNAEGLHQLSEKVKKD